MKLSDRFLVLSHLIDEVPRRRGGDLIRVVSLACFAVVRNMQGRASDTEARYALNRARAELLNAFTPRERLRRRVTFLRRRRRRRTLLSARAVRSACGQAGPQR